VAQVDTRWRLPARQGGEEETKLGPLAVVRRWRRSSSVRSCLSEPHVRARSRANLGLDLGQDGSVLPAVRRKPVGGEGVAGLAE
jgi:hypothetical protein